MKRDRKCNLVIPRLLCLAPNPLIKVSFALVLKFLENYAQSLKYEIAENQCKTSKEFMS